MGILKIILLSSAEKYNISPLLIANKDDIKDIALGNKDVVKPYTQAAVLAHELGLGINAGHDLSLENIRFFKEHMPELLEVSIGHALISDALYYGLENTIQMYLRKLNF